MLSCWCGRGGLGWVQALSSGVWRLVFEISDEGQFCRESWLWESLREKRRRPLAWGRCELGTLRWGSSGLPGCAVRRCVWSRGEGCQSLVAGGG